MLKINMTQFLYVNFWIKDIDIPIIKSMPFIAAAMAIGMLG